MAFDKTELEVAHILLQFPRLIRHSEIQFCWGSMKKRSMGRPSPLSRRKTPVPFPNSKNIRITLKRSSKQSENHHRNSTSRCGDNKRRSCLCAVNDESLTRKKVKQSCAESSRPFLLPDLNVPPSTEEEEERYCTKDGISPRSVAARDQDGRNRCCSSKDLIVGVKFGSDGRNH